MTLKIKNIIICLIISYIIIVSILFISQSFKLKKVSEKKLESDVSVEHVNFLDNSIKIIESNNKYKSRDKCVVAIRDAIVTEKMYKYAEVKTFKELYTNLYEILGDEEKSRLSNVSKVLNDCNLKLDERGNIDENKKEIREYLVLHATYQVAVVQHSFHYDYMNNISIKIDIPQKIIDTIALPYFSGVRSKNKVDLRSILITEQKEYVEKLLDFAGGKYE